jgi:hypothetical protein
MPENLITPPSSFDEALTLLVALGGDEFLELSRAISGPQSFSLSSSQLKDLQSKITAISDYLPVLLGALSFVYNTTSKLRDSGKSVEDIVAQLVAELDLNKMTPVQVDLMRERLEALLKPNPGYARFRKIRGLQDGFLPNAISFRSMVDLRPDFGDGDAPSYQGLLKIVQFRVRTDSNNPELKEFVFQLSEEALEELGKSVTRAREKLAALQREASLSKHFIELKQ